MRPVSWRSRYNHAYGVPHWKAPSTFPDLGRTQHQIERDQNPAPKDELAEETRRIARTIFDATRALTLKEYLPDGVSRRVAQDFFDEKRTELIAMYEEAIAQILEARKTGHTSRLVQDLAEMTAIPAPVRQAPAVEREEVVEIEATEEPELEPLPEPVKQKLEDIVGSVSALKLLELSQAMDAPLPASFLQSLHRKPFHFQRAGVAYMGETGRALLADEQGTGKTLQVLTALRYFRHKGHNTLPVLIVVPYNVKLNWALETIRVSPDWKDRIALMGEYRPTVIQVAGIGPVTLLPEKDAAKAQVVICNYDILYSRCRELLEIPFQAMILDESHRIKNPSAQRTEAAIEIAYELEIPFRFALTGTPYAKDTMELWPQIEFLGLDEHSAFANFRDQFGIRVSGVEDTGGMLPEDRITLLEMNKVLRSTCMIRREKKDVLSHLPPKRRYTHVVALSNRAEYDRAYAEFRNWLVSQFMHRLKYVIGLLQGKKDRDPSRAKKYRRDIAFVEQVKQKKLSGEALQVEVQEYVLDRVSTSLRALVLTKLGKLKQIAARGKIPAVQRYLNDVFQRDSDAKALLFGWHREVVEDVASTFDAPLIYGRTSAVERFNIVERFQYEPKPKLCVLNLLAGREGLTMTRADRVVFIELGWDAMTHDQAEDRAHRIDPLERNRAEVRCEYFLGQDTIDEAIARFIERKRNLTRLGVSGDDSDHIPEGRITDGLGRGLEGVDDVGGFIRSMIKSETDDTASRHSIESLVSQADFEEIVKALEYAAEEERGAGRDEEVQLFYQEQKED